jgi:hypothetical protein
VTTFSRPEALDITFYSILVLREAVVRSYAGGLKAFDQDFLPARPSQAIAKLVRMSAGDTEHLLGQLNAAGLVLGVDFAVADMMEGPLLECPGIIFEGTDGFPPRWLASALCAPPEQHETPLIDALGTADTPWITIATREASGAIDSWEEVLQVCKADRGWHLQVFRHVWLGEVPLDWYDEDGELHPEHQDADRDLKLPETIDGKGVTGYADGGFLGSLIAVSDECQLTECSLDAIGAALEAVNWPKHDASDVYDRLSKLRLSGTCADVGEVLSPAREQRSPDAAQREAALADTNEPLKSVSSPWRRISGPGGLVHWRGGCEVEGE